METKNEDLISTARNISEYASGFGMTRNELLSWLRSKENVLNLGAGGGVLEKEIEILKDKANAKPKIFSLDIAYGTKKGLNYSRFASHLLNIIPSIEFLNKINSTFERKSIAANFESIPFADETFEGVLGNYSHTHIKDKDILKKTYLEIYRVLKPGGEALISTAYGMNIYDLPFVINRKVDDMHTHALIRK